MIRGMYLIMAVGLALNVWPNIISQDANVQPMTSVVHALLGGLGLLAALRLRYPVQMLPLLLFELTWKLIWLGAFALPRWLGGSLDPVMGNIAFETSLGLVLLLVIPWPFLIDNYLRKPAERSGQAPGAVTA
jgi:hypothetical protein